MKNGWIKNFGEKKIIKCLIFYDSILTVGLYLYVLHVASQRILPLGDGSSRIIDNINSILKWKVNL